MSLFAKFSSPLAAPSCSVHGLKSAEYLLELERLSRSFSGSALDRMPFYLKSELLDAAWINAALEASGERFNDGFPGETIRMRTKFYRRRA